MLQVFCWKQQPTPIPPEFWGVPLDLIADVGASRCEDPKLINYSSPDSSTTSLPYSVMLGHYGTGYAKASVYDISGSE